MYQGAPVAGAAVAFQPSDGSSVALAETDAQGVFSLVTQGEPGAVVGQHQVSVTKFTGGNPDMAKVADPDPSKGPQMSKESTSAVGTGGTKNELPAKYSNVVTSELIFNVTEQGPNDFTIELKDE
jgi:hypothetical protein